MAAPTAVAPALRSSKHAVALSAAVVVLIALPAILAALGLYRRRDAYLEMPAGDGSFAYAAKEVLDERADVDVLMVGDSMLWLGVDPVYVEEELARAEGRPAVVLAFGHNWRGVDLDYGLVRDTLARRRVKTLALAVAAAEDEQDGPHHYATHFLPYFDDPTMLAGLPLRNRLTLYASSVIGAPRHVLSLLRPNLETERPFQVSLGAHPVEAGFEGAPYHPTDRAPPVLPAGAMMRSRSPERFAFAGTPLSAYQAHFVRLIADLVREHGVRLVLFHVPRWSSHARPVVDERVDWPAVYGAPSELIGVPPAVLFQGMREDEIKSLYCNEHLNAAGARYFTRTITPALLEVYRHGPETH